ncbi:restriction endonuclease subunit S [Aeromonas hydrophila]|uniref:restriction endonuclease subunit S n=1 Tax=Aeromonas hydrophila TaxID=644 RepID=UPI002B4A7C9B|nr:restriction endonuclease subunit S [Aeromonas hydrophila]
MSDAVATSQQGRVEKYQPYPEYDDSGIEWLGRIPVHWKLATLKHECVFSGGGTPTKDNLAYWGGNIPWISPKDMKSQVVTDSIDKITAVAVAESSTKLVPEGALLMVVRSGILQRTIPVAINTVPVTLNQDMKALRFKSKDKACFFLYYIQGLESQLLLEWCKQGATVESIEHELLANARYPLPPNDELKAINQFLDYETARIDRLITQQLRLIELLKEKRQAVISHAVTKGLNPNAPMIDSGVEWLGQVPAHWVVRRLKHTAEIHSGIPKGKDLSGKDTITVPMLRVANVQDGYLNLDNVHEIEIEPHELVRYSLRAGDVLMNEGGDNDKLGRGAVWPGQIIPCIHQNHVFAIRVNNIEPEWLSWLTSSSYAKYYFYSVSKQSTNLASISSSNVKETPLVLPPKNERVEIMRYLDEKIAKLSGIESQAALQIELLQERRTALISAAVTGKIDLRGWTQPAEEAAV